MNEFDIYIMSIALQQIIYFLQRSNVLLLKHGENYKTKTNTRFVPFCQFHRNPFALKNKIPHNLGCNFKTGAFLLIKLVLLYWGIPIS